MRRPPGGNRCKPGHPLFAGIAWSSAFHPGCTGRPRSCPWPGTGCPRPFRAWPLHHLHPSVNPLSHMVPGENDPPADPQAGKPGLGCQAVGGCLGDPDDLGKGIDREEIRQGIQCLLFRCYHGNISFRTQFVSYHKHRNHRTG